MADQEEGENDSSFDSNDDELGGFEPNTSSIFEDDDSDDSFDKSTPSCTQSSTVLNDSTNIKLTPVATTMSEGKGRISARGVQKRLPFHSPISESRKNVEKQLNTILSEVRETKGRIDEWDKKIDSIEQRLTMLESPVTSSSDDFTTPQKRKVPNRVRHLVRELYKTLLEDDENFPGFNLKKKYCDKENQTIVKKLVEETKGQDTSLSILHIKDAVRRFFLSKSEESALKEKGKYDIKVLKQRRRNRINKKLEARKAALQKTGAMPEEKKTKWKEILVHSFISSEESGEECGHGGLKSPVLFVKRLPWRSDHVSKFFKQLDRKVEKSKSKRGSQQTLPRVVSRDCSSRAKPVIEFGPQHWAYV